MSEVEAPVAEAPANESTPAPESQAPEPKSTSGLFSQQTESPFSAFYTEEGGVAETVPDGPFKSFLSKYGDPAKANDGFANLNKLASSKGVERPGEDATPEEVQAFQQKLRDLKGVPEKAEDYKVEFPEDLRTNDEITQKIAEFGIEKGFAPSEMQELVPFHVEMVKQSNELAAQEYVNSELESLNEFFGGSDAREKAEPALLEFLKGNDLGLTGTGPMEGVNMPTHTDYYKLAMKAHELSAKVAQLTGEDSSVKGGAPMGSASNAMEKLQKYQDPSSREYDLLMNPVHGQAHADAKRDYLSVARIVTDSKRNANWQAPR